VGRHNPKTTGGEWLYMSMASFNGSGYADKSSAQHYIESYRAYKMMKKHHQAINTLNVHQEEALLFAEKLASDSVDSKYEPSEKNLRKFHQFYDVEQMSLL
jgi:hypothetical protein